MTNGPHPVAGGGPSCRAGLAWPGVASRPLHHAGEGFQVGEVERPAEPVDQVRLGWGVRVERLPETGHDGVGAFGVGG